MVAVKCKRRYLEPVFGLFVLGSCKNINICQNGLHRRGPPGVCRYKRLIPRSRFLFELEQLVQLAPYLALLS